MVNATKRSKGTYIVKRFRCDEEWHETFELLNNIKESTRLSCKVTRKAMLNISFTKGLRIGRNNEKYENNAWYNLMFTFA